MSTPQKTLRKWRGMLQKTPHASTQRTFSELPFFGGFEGLTYRWANAAAIIAPSAAIIAPATCQRPACPVRRASI